MASYGEFIEETTTTTGTGAITLVGGGQAGSRTFNQEIPDGDYTEYTIIASDNQWETGFGILTAAGPSINRSHVIRSSNADAAIVLPAGTHLVTQAASAQRFAFHGVKAFAAATQTFNTAVWKQIDFDTPSVNTDAIWSAGNADRFTIPPWARAFKINAMISFAGTGSVQTYGARVHKNDVLTLEQGASFVALTAIGGPRLPVSSGEIGFTAGDFFSLASKQETGGNQDIDTFSWIELQIIP